MRSVIIVHPDFDAVWPFAADHFHRLWQAQGAVEFTRLKHEDTRPLNAVVAYPETVTRLVSLGVPLTPQCVQRLTALREVVLTPNRSVEIREALQAAGVRIYTHPSEGFWGQSV